MSIYNDYGAAYGSGAGVYGAGAALATGFIIFFVIMMIISLLISVVLLVSLFKIFKQNNKPGWFAIIPIFNMWTLFEICGYKGFFAIIPLANIVFMYMSYYKLAVNNGKSAGFGILTALFPFIGLPIIAFGKKNTKVADTNNVGNDIQSGNNGGFTSGDGSDMPRVNVNNASNEALNNVVNQSNLETNVSNIGYSMPNEETSTSFASSSTINDVNSFDDKVVKEESITNFGNPVNQEIGESSPINQGPENPINDNNGFNNN